MIYVEAPKEYYGVIRSRWPSLFLAGGITGCDDWQKQMVENLSREEVIIYNPRRENFPIDDPDAAEVQITWEFDKLAKVDIVSFWFAYGTDNPIVLYELGMWGNAIPGRPIAIGCDEKYSRKMDVLIQTALARPDIFMAGSLYDLSIMVRNILRYMNGGRAPSGTGTGTSGMQDKIRKVSEK